MAVPRVVQAAADDADSLIKQQEPKQEGEQSEANQQPVGENWEQKFKTLQGKYNAELGVAREDNKALQDKLAEATANIKELNERANKLEEEASLKKSGDLAAMLESVKDKYDGEELFGVVEATAKSQSELGQANRNLSKEISDLKARIGQTQDATQKTAEQLFAERLLAAVPNLNEINTNPDFIDWMNEVDPSARLYTSAPHPIRQQVMEAAQRRNDSVAAIAIYNEWLAKKGPQEESSKIPEAHIQPELSGSGEGEPEGKPIYTMEQVKKFYDDVVHGRKYSSEEVERIDRDIHAARLEGRIVS